MVKWSRRLWRWYGRGTGDHDGDNIVVIEKFCWSYSGDTGDLHDDDNIVVIE